MEQQTVFSSDNESHWIQIQGELKKRLIMEDDFKWELPSSLVSSSSWSSSVELNVERRKEVLKYIGGVDISFLKQDPSVACGTLVVLELDSLNVVYDDFFVSKLHVPYVPGFLAFREVPILMKLIDKMKKDAHPLYPQLLMVDGNGLLHPRGFGLACHLGVLGDLPTIGIGKNLHHVDGLDNSEVREKLEANGDQETVFLTGNSGHTLGVAVRSSLGAVKPIFVSIGHRISLTMAPKDCQNDLQVPYSRAYQTGRYKITRVPVETCSSSTRSTSGCFRPLSKPGG